MRYKTMVLEMLRQRSQLHDRLAKQGALLTTLDRMARELKSCHEAWKQQLAETRPGSDPSQTASEALEIALKEMADSLPPEWPQNEDEPFSLDAAMAFIRRRTPPA
jgi:hypothetical protein